jgi:hypothetical protein
VWGQRGLQQSVPINITNVFIARNTAGGGKAKYVLTNTCVMHYANTNSEHAGNVVDNGLYYARVELPQRPPSFTGDLFLAMDLQRTVRGDVAYQVTLQQEQYSLLFTAWVQVLAMQPPVEVHIGVDVMGSLGASLGTVTKQVWLDTTLIQSYRTDITPPVGASTSVTVTMLPSVIYDLSEHGGKLYDIDGLQNLFLVRANMSIQ